MGYFQVKGNVLVLSDFETPEGKFNLALLVATDSALKFYGDERVKQLLNGAAALLNAYGTKHTKGAPPKIPKEISELVLAKPKSVSRRRECPLCGQRDVLTNRHHLHPRVNGEPKLGPIIFTCRSCHDAIHSYFTNEELRNIYNTENSLKEALKRVIQENLRAVI